jgi:uncharacterized protein YecT (DUF1311 family)
MQKKVWVLAAVAIVAAVASAAVVQADGGAPADAAKPAPPAIPSFTPQPCPPEPVSTPEVMGCVEERLLKADKRINQLNAAIFSELSKAQVLRKFLASHRAWLAYRNSDCLDIWASLEEGTIFPIAVGECEVTLDKQRIKNLRTFMRFPEG